MERNAELGDFLRTRRARMSPADAGVAPGGGFRRVPGLRREEVAYVAGVSTDYYTRLEQGRHPNVSEAVLDAVARALRLDDDERGHLFDQLARALITDWDTLPYRERNFARYVLLDPGARELYLNWHEVAETVVADLRLEAGRHPDDARLNELIGEAVVKVPEFGSWWDSHRVAQCVHGTQRFQHPVVGEITLHHETLVFPADPGQTVCVYTAEPGSASAQALALLASWSAPENTAAPEPAEADPGAA
ncbi:helix-turn-helix transcriptional regulator [Streptomyces afghaniensis]|uniref:helix-turn-helix transcriptional regulator n=1 Tax=Streptomyces afghaniensis TaxID=66865 RepID=UPI0033AC9E66